MKRIMFLILLTPSLLIASQGTLQYQGQEGFVQLPVVPNRITVMVDSSQFINWDSILTSDPAIDASQELGELWGGFHVVHLLDGADPLTVIANLNGRPDVAFAYPVFHSTRGEDIYITNHIVVQFNNVVSVDQIDSIRAFHELGLVTTLFQNDRYQVLQLAPHNAILPLDIVTEISATNVAVDAYPSFILPLELDYDPNDIYWSNQWYFKNTGQFGGPADVDIDLDEALDYTIPGTDTLLIAVLDNGFVDHPDFPWARVARAWDYSTMDSSSPGDPDVAPHQLPPHGVAVTGVLTATTDNSTGLSGAIRPSQRVGIIAHKIFRDLIGQPPEWVTARAIQDAVDLGAQVMSCSWSGDPQSGGGYAIYDALTYADMYGTIVVFSAGNDASAVNYPSFHPQVLAVGATDSLDHKWPYSNFGAELDVMAPSATIDGTWGNFWILDKPGPFGDYSGGQHGCTGVDHDYNCKFAGTSAAAPQVAGIAALILLRRPDLRSTWWNNHTDIVREIIRHSAEDQVGDANDTPGWDQYYGWGRVNAAHALRTVARGDCNNNGIINIADANYLVQYILAGGPAPQPDVKIGDCHCSGIINVADAVYMVQYIFASGPPPGDWNNDGYFDCF